MTKTLKDLQNRTACFTTSLPFMDGREKAKIDDLMGKKVTIENFGFLKGENGEDYACFIVKEDKANFYFGGLVITDNLKNLEKEGYKETIVSEGLPVLLTEEKSKTGRKYTAVTYFPE